MKVGDDLGDFQYERKGNYDRITNIGSSSSTGSSQSPASNGTAPTSVKSDFPISMKVSYAKDLLVASTVGTPKEAVAIINELESEFKASAKGASDTNPTTSSGKS